MWWELVQYLVLTPMGVWAEPTALFEGVDNALRLIGYNPVIAEFTQQALYRTFGF